MRAAIAYWVFVAALCTFAGAGAYVIHLQNAPARAAIPVTAKIEHSEIVSTHDGRGRPIKRPLVIYSYDVAGVRYTTDRLTALARSHGDAWADEIVRRYHVGESVTAYRSPTDPGSAFLITERSWRMYAFVIVPLAIAIALVVYWPRAIGNGMTKAE